MEKFWSTLEVEKNEVLLEDQVDGMRLETQPSSRRGVKFRENDVSSFLGAINENDTQR